MLLGAIRIVNGTSALVAPAEVGRRLGIDPEQNKAAPYVTRLFGIRTLVIGVALIRGDRDAIRRAPLIHVADTIAAVLAGAGGELPRRAARTAAAISSVNTVLALLARRDGR